MCDTGESVIEGRTQHHEHYAFPRHKYCAQLGFASLRELNQRLKSIMAEVHA